MMDPVLDWLVGDARAIDSTELLITELALRSREAGVQVDRLQVAATVLDPILVGRAWIWRSDQPFAQIDLPHGELSKPRFINSPIHTIFTRADTLQRRLTGPHAQLDYPVLHELAAEGFTDYGAVRLGSTTHPSIGIAATKCPGGLSPAQWELLTLWSKVLGLHVARHEAHRTAAMLLDTYVGRRTGEEILGGRIQRGQIEQIDAAIWMSDLRGFTAITHRLGPEATLNVLNAYFEVMATEIQAAGGEVLKFIGDGILAIFPTDGADPEAACNNALRAAKRAHIRLDAASEHIQEPIQAGIALDLGAVTWGNIGSTKRLDFTVIGEAVNRVSRIESLCRPLEQSVLVSERFAAVSTGPFRSVGVHEVHGLREAIEIFAPI